MTRLVFYYQHASPCPAFEVLEALVKQGGKHEITDYFDEFRVDAYVLADRLDSRRVAIDYDNTITAAPEFYIALIAAYRAAGWEPLVCTLRCEEEANLAEIREKLRDPHIPIYTTDGQMKRTHLLDQGVPVGLWIDDFFPSVACPGAWILQVNGITY